MEGLERPGFRVYGSNDADGLDELANQDANTLKTTHTVISGGYRYVRIRVNKLSSGSAGIYEWKLYAAATDPDPHPDRHRHRHPDARRPTADRHRDPGRRPRPPPPP